MECLIYATFICCNINRFNEDQIDPVWFQQLQTGQDATENVRDRTIQTQG